MLNVLLYPCNENYLYTNFGNDIFHKGSLQKDDKKIPPIILPISACYYNKFCEFEYNSRSIMCLLSFPLFIFIFIFLWGRGRRLKTCNDRNGFHIYKMVTVIHERVQLSETRNVVYVSSHSSHCIFAVRSVSGVIKERMFH